MAMTHASTSAVKIYDLPADAEEFYGQGAYIQQIHDFFAGSADKKHLAVWGTLGIGKTELVLRYAVKYRDQYDVIKWFDASWQETLRTQMETFYDFLSTEKALTPDASTGDMQTRKCDAVISWLSKQKRVLLIYDNTGVSMDPVDLRDYIPQHCSAHRIVIGSSSSTCSLANHYIEVRPMTQDDATLMFCGLAQLGKVENPCELDTIHQIVEETDRKPFHLTYAASNFRDGQTELAAFLERIRSQKRNAQLQSSRLLTGDGSYLWALTFEEIRQRRNSLALLYLFSFLDGFDINSKLLERFHKPCHRWSEKGEHITISAEEDGVDPEIAAMLRDEELFESALKPLLHATFVRRKFNTGKPGWTRRIEMQPLDQEFVLRTMPLSLRIEWTKKIILLVSHAVPQDPSLERNTLPLWSHLIHHVLKCHELAKGYRSQDLEDVHGPLVSMLLSSVGLSRDDRGLLNMIDSLLLGCRGTIAQRCLAAKWRSYYLFFDENKKRDAEMLLGRVQHDVITTIEKSGDLSALNNAALADVIFHRAQCLSDLGQNDEAIQVLQCWRVPGDSRVERRSKILMGTALNKMFILTGSLGRAKLGLTCIQQQADYTQDLKSLEEFGWVTVILGQLCCHMEEWSVAVAVVTPLMQKYLRDGNFFHFVTSDLRLINCEALLGSGQYNEFDTQLDELERALLRPEQKGNQRLSSQLLAARRLRARSFYCRQQWSQAISAWTILLQALGVGEHELTSNLAVLSSSTSQTYEKAEGTYSLALAYWQSGQMEKAQQLCTIALQDPAYLRRTSANVDDSRWLEYIRAEHQDLIQRQPQKKWSWFASIVAGLYVVWICEFVQTKFWHRRM